MKAYCLSVKDREEQGMVIVFSENYKKALNSWDCDLDYDSWIDRRCRRIPEFDGMENASHYEIVLKQWREGWFFDSDIAVPSELDSTENDFKAWYEKEFSYLLR